MGLSRRNALKTLLVRATAVALAPLAAVQSVVQRAQRLTEVQVGGEAVTLMWRVRSAAGLSYEKYGRIPGRMELGVREAAMIPAHLQSVDTTYGLVEIVRTNVASRVLLRVAQGVGSASTNW